MKTTSNPAELIRDALLSPAEGIVGLVESLLSICKTHGLQLNWEAERCRVLSIGSGSEELVDVPLRKSVFRAMLARIAALCNDYDPDSVSPYGGHGTLRAGGDSSTQFNVIFVNTANEQRLDIGVKL